MRTVRAMVACAAAMAFCCLVATGAGAKLPNDTFLDANQDGRFDKGAWDHTTTNGRQAENLYYLKQTGAYKAWRRSTGDEVVVAVLDTGVDMNHPDLKNNIYTDPGEIPNNGIDDDGNGKIDDVHGWDFSPDSSDGKPGEDNDPTDNNGHGTAVAGIVAAEQGNGIGISGVAPNVKILPVKVTGARSTDFTAGVVGPATAYLLENPDVDIINVSGGLATAAGDPFGPIVCSLVDAALASGKLIVAAAGNGAFNTYPARDVGTPAGGGFEPANCPNSIGVTATTGAIGASLRRVERSPFADYGGAVDIAAPGGGGDLLHPGGPGGGDHPEAAYLANNMLTLRAANTNGVRRYIGDSTAFSDFENYTITDDVSKFTNDNSGQGEQVDGKYVHWRGTSFAAPQVTGAIALMLSASPALDQKPGVDQFNLVRDILRRSAKRFNTTDLDKDDAGKPYGHLDVHRAVARARRVK